MIENTRIELKRELTDNFLRMTFPIVEPVLTDQVTDQATDQAEARIIKVIKALEIPRKRSELQILLGIPIRPIF